MNLYFYSDESGVLDKAHNDYYVFGGLIFLSDDERDGWEKDFLRSERAVRVKEGKNEDDEVKAAKISSSSKNRLFRSIAGAEKFGAVIKQKELIDSLFFSKKAKQRYLDFVYNSAVQCKIDALILKKKIIPDTVERMFFYVDEHTTATDGIYELKELLEQNYRFGVYDWKTMTCTPSPFSSVKEVSVRYCDSSKVPLVRAADITANRLYYMSLIQDYGAAKNCSFDYIVLP